MCYLSLKQVLESYRDLALIRKTSNHAVKEAKTSEDYFGCSVFYVVKTLWIRLGMKLI